MRRNVLVPLFCSLLIASPAYKKRKTHWRADTDVDLGACVALPCGKLEPLLIVEDRLGRRFAHVSLEKLLPSVAKKAWSGATK
jgi:hypothetical protein